MWDPKPGQVAIDKKIPFDQIPYLLDDLRAQLAENRGAGCRCLPCFKIKFHGKIWSESGNEVDIEQIHESSCVTKQ